MALPVSKAADLAKDMAKKGLVGSISMEKPDEMDMPEKSGDLEPILADIDKRVPGLGALVHELVERLQAGDEKQDEDMME